MSGDLDYGNRNKRVIILQNDNDRRFALAELARNSGCIVNEMATPDRWAIEGSAANGSHSDLLLCDFRSESDNVEDYLSIIVQYLNEYGTGAILWADSHSLEAAYAVLPVGQCHFIVDGEDYEALPVLSGNVRRMTAQGFRQVDEPADYRSLHRISDELADFARTLARLAQQDDSGGSEFRDKPVSFRPAPSAIFEPLPTSAPAQITAPEIRKIIQLRRRRDRYFPAALFADPAWDIMLDLFAAKLEGKRVSVSSLCIAAAVPATTALRWIGTMTEDGLLVREQDHNDARRVFIALSETAEQGLRDYFADVGRASGTAI
jgi:hypothetical protein